MGLTGSSSGNSSAIAPSINTSINPSANQSTYSTMSSSIGSSVGSAVDSSTGPSVGSSVDSSVGSSLGSSSDSSSGSSSGSVDSSADPSVNPSAGSVNSSSGTFTGSSVDYPIGSSADSPVDSSAGSSASSSIGSSVSSSVDSSAGSVDSSAGFSAGFSAGSSAGSSTGSSIGSSVGSSAGSSAGSITNQSADSSGSLFSKPPPVAYACLDIINDIFRILTNPASYKTYSRATVPRIFREVSSSVVKKLAPISGVSAIVSWIRILEIKVKEYETALAKFDESDEFDPYQLILDKIGKAILDVKSDTISEQRRIIADKVNNELIKKFPASEYDFTGFIDKVDKLLSLYQNNRKSCSYYTLNQKLNIELIVEEDKQNSILRAIDLLEVLTCQKCGLLIDTHTTCTKYVPLFEISNVPPSVEIEAFIPCATCGKQESDHQQKICTDCSLHNAGKHCCFTFHDDGRGSCSNCSYPIFKHIYSSLFRQLKADSADCVSNKMNQMIDVASKHNYRSLETDIITGLIFATDWIEVAKQGEKYLSHPLLN
jgi:hypothetical protein